MRATAHQLLLFPATVRPSSLGERTRTIPGAGR